MAENHGKSVYHLISIFIQGTWKYRYWNTILSEMCDVRNGYDGFRRAILNLVLCV